VADFRSANRYYLFEHLAAAHLQVDFEGSNDSGRTWRTFEMRDLPQGVDRMAGFIAPRFPRFENTIFFESSRPGERSVITVVATELLRRNPEIMARFKRDPFPDRPPTIMRMRRYRLSLTEPDFLRTTGHYWRKEFAGDYLPALYLTERGEVSQFSLAGIEAATKAGDHAAAVRLAEQQYALGNLDAGHRLAELYVRGAAGAVPPARIAALFAELAERGELKAMHSLGLCHEHGAGVPVDLAKAAELYRRAAEGGYPPSMYAVGSLVLKGPRQSRPDIEGLAWLLTFERRASADEAAYRPIREEARAKAAQLMSRMSAPEIAAARAIVAARR
jgi:hypothetical protein